MRMISVFLPHLPIERLKREGRLIRDEQPFALVGSEAHGLRLTALNAASVAHGLLPGLSLADAKAICPRLATLPTAPEKDAEALSALARWSGRYSPTLNKDGSDGLWLDVTGIPHLFGGEQKLLAELARRLAVLGFTPRLALAETHGGAHALARYDGASCILVPKGKIRGAIAALPIEALRLTPDVVLLLKRLGLKRIGQLYDLPRESLQRRFHSRDAAEAVLLRLDQALGLRKEKHPPLCPPPAYAARLPFPEALLTHEGVEAALAHLAGALCERLAKGLAGTRRVGLTLYRSDGSLASIEAGLSTPSREPSHLLRLLTEKIQSLDLGFGIDLMCLASMATEKLPLAQASFAAPDRKAEALPLIDRLINHLGRKAVRRLFPQASHLPERAQIPRSAFAGAPIWNATDYGPPKPPHPPLLFPRPEPLQVVAEVPEGPPASFTWRRVTRRVTKSQGPERIAPEWWRLFPSPGKGESDAAQSAASGEGHDPNAKEPDPLPNPPPSRGREFPRTRDYYRIEDEDGRRYWVFREGLYGESGATPAWYLHGLFG